MHMRTQGHQKPYVSKQADRPDTAHKHHGKGKKILKTAGKVLGGVLVGALMTSLPLKSSGQNARDDGQDTKNIPVVASANVPLLVLIYNATGEDLSKSAAKVKPGTTPTDDPKQKWCEGIEIENGNLIFKGIHKGNDVGDAITGVEDFLAKFGVPGATTKDIIWTAFRTINGQKKAYFIIEKNGISLLATSNPDFEKIEGTWGKGLCADDNTKIFTHPGAILITEDGTIVATTPTTLLTIDPGENGFKSQVYYRKYLGNGPDLISPFITLEGEFAKISDNETMTSNEGILKILYHISTGRVGLFKNEDFPSIE